MVWVAEGLDMAPGGQSVSEAPGHSEHLSQLKPVRIGLFGWAY